MAQAGRSLLSFPTNTSGYILEYTTNLAGGPWFPVSSPLSVVGGSNLLTNTLEAPAVFYRLRKP